MVVSRESNVALTTIPLQKKMLYTYIYIVSIALLVFFFFFLEYKLSSTIVNELLNLKNRFSKNTCIGAPCLYNNIYIFFLKYHILANPTQNSPILGHVKLYKKT